MKIAIAAVIIGAAMIAGCYPYEYCGCPGEEYEVVEVMEVVSPPATVPPTALLPSCDNTVVGIVYYRGELIPGATVYFSDFSFAEVTGFDGRTPPVCTGSRRKLYVTVTYGAISRSFTYTVRKPGSNIMKLYLHK